MSEDLTMDAVTTWVPADNAEEVAQEVERHGFDPFVEEDDLWSGYAEIGFGSVDGDEPIGVEQLIAILDTVMGTVPFNYRAIRVCVPDERYKAVKAVLDENGIFESVETPDGEWTRGVEYETRY
jgi:hypothetical protein